MSRASVIYFDPDCGIDPPVGANCPWCQLPVLSDEPGFLVRNYAKSGIGFASAYHRECWQARFCEGIYESGGDPHLARAAYLTSYEVWLSGGHRALDVSCEKLVASPPPPGVSERR